MKVLGIGTIKKTKENVKWYDRKGYHMTGKTLMLGDENTSTEYVVFKGSWTRSGTVRDCGSHYIYAGHSAYYKIDKSTLEITYDVEDC
jgi:hypothetical protein